MAKFSLPKQMNKITRSSVRVPTAMLISIDDDMKASGFNRKQRSQWLEVIISDFLKRTDCANLIAEEFIVPGSTAAIPISLSDQLIDTINATLETVEKDELIIKDRSAVIRTAITQRLLTRAGMQLSPKETSLKKIEAFGGNDAS